MQVSKCTSLRTLDLSKCDLNISVGSMLDVLWNLTQLENLAISKMQQPIFGKLCQVGQTHRKVPRHSARRLLVQINRPVAVPVARLMDNIASTRFDKDAYADSKEGKRVSTAGNVSTNCACRWTMGSLMPWQECPT